MTPDKFILYLITMAGVTYLVRVIPLVLVKKRINNEFLRSFLHYIPYSVLAAMTFPAAFFSTASVISAGVGILIALLLAYKDKSLLVVSFSACVGVFVTEFIMRMV